MRFLKCLRIPQLEVWARRYANLSGALSWDNTLENSGPGVVPETTKVWIGITSSKCAWIGQMRCSLVCKSNVDDNRVVICDHHRSHMEVMEVWICWGLLASTSMGKFYLAPTLGERQKISWRWGKGPSKSPRGLNERGGGALPTLGRMARPLWALVQYGSIVA